VCCVKISELAAACVVKVGLRPVGALTVVSLLAEGSPFTGFHSIHK
jgi:hypothetical protein